MKKIQIKQETTKFYRFSQNNSGGSFVTNDKLCHRLFIEAESYQQAKEKAEGFGVYYNGVADGHDCDCCGDRWYDSEEEIKDYTEDYPVECSGDRAAWLAKYGDYTIVQEPERQDKFGHEYWHGKIKFKNIFEYAQFYADELGWTTPDIRIFFADGTIKEIFSKKEGD
jgi:hypothetical protein